jgi:hypothetical protein
MRGRAILTAVLTGALLSCDALSGLVEPQWTVDQGNGKDGQFHFVMNSYAMRIGQPEHVRVERIETRTLHKPGGAEEVQKHERKVRVVMARCESASICSAIPHSQDTREIVVTPKIMGGTTLYVTAVVDEKEEFKDSIVVHVQ